MSQPGWYPDPAGQPGQFRYWDGSQWSHQTSPSPQAPPPGAEAFAPVQGRSGGAGRLVVVAALLLVMGLIAWLVIRGLGGDGGGAAEDTNSSTPTVSSWDESSTPSPTPSEPEESNASMVNCPEGSSSGEGEFRDGRIHSGKLSAPSTGWDLRRYNIKWIHNAQTEFREITLEWINMSQVGMVKKSDGFTDPKRAAHMLMSCFATSFAYRGYSGRKDLEKTDQQVSGRPGYLMRSEIYVNDMGDIKGDGVEIVVVDTGEPESLSVWVGTYTLGMSDIQTTIETTRKGLKVEG